MGLDGNHSRPTWKYSPFKGEFLRTSGLDWVAATPRWERDHARRVVSLRGAYGKDGVSPVQLPV